MSGQESSLKLHSWPCLIKQPQLVVQAWELFAPSSSLGKVSTSMLSSTSIVLWRLTQSAGSWRDSRIDYIYFTHVMGFILSWTKSFSSFLIVPCRVTWMKYCWKLNFWGHESFSSRSIKGQENLIILNQSTTIFFCFLNTGEITCQCSESILTCFQLWKIAYYLY